MGLKRAFFLILILSLLVILWYYKSKDEKKSAEIILEKNNVGFTGSIVSYAKSKDRSFGLIRFKIINSNKQNFNVSDSRVLYPYRLEKGYGEFYGYIPLEIKVGQLIELRAGEKSVKLYDERKKVAKTSVFIIADRKFIDYVNEHTSFSRLGQSSK